MGLLGQGWGEDDIPRNYPGLAREDIFACLQYASQGSVKAALDFLDHDLQPQPWLQGQDGRALLELVDEGTLIGQLR
jgi:hypothetical protein